MKNNNLIYDWIDFVAQQKANNKRLLKEDSYTTKDIGGVQVKSRSGLEIFSNPRNTKIKGIVIHHTHTKNSNSTYNVLKQRKLSTNYEVDKNGTIYEYVSPENAAWATAGGANIHTIAIDVTHYGRDDFPSVQIKALKNLVNALSSKYGFQLKLAPDNTRLKWEEWNTQFGSERYTLFRHRNFVNTSCPENLPMEQLVDGIESYIFSDPVKAVSQVASDVYTTLKDVGSDVYKKAKETFTESIDLEVFNIEDKSSEKIYEKNKKYFDSLLTFLKKQLKITKPVKIILEDDEKNSKKVLGRTGGYINKENKIHIFVTSRHIKDILRSLAHEMVHHKQNIRGEFKNNEPTIHGYAQSNPHLRKMEKEAYSEGNLLFRDWEDDYKYRNKK